MRLDVLYSVLKMLKEEQLLPPDENWGLKLDACIISDSGDGITLRLNKTPPGYVERNMQGKGLYRFNRHAEYVFLGP